MSKKKQQERKKKQREERAKERVLARRKFIREAQKEERRRAMFERKFSPKIEPILNDPEKRQAREEAKKKRVIEQLERNQQILQALEDQYVKDQEAKAELNAELEAEGHTTLKQKMDAIEEKAKSEVEKKKKGFRFGGEAEVKVTPAVVEETEI